MQTIAELLSDLETDLAAQTAALSLAQKLSTSPEERARIIRASRRSWRRLEAARRELDRMAG